MVQEIKTRDSRPAVPFLLYSVMEPVMIDAQLCDYPSLSACYTTETFVPAQSFSKIISIDYLIRISYNAAYIIVLQISKRSEHGYK